MFDRIGRWLRFRVLLKFRGEYYYFKKKKFFIILNADDQLIKRVQDINKQYKWWNLYILYIILSFILSMYLYLSYTVEIQLSIFIVLFLLNIIIYCFLAYMYYSFSKKANRLIVKEIEKKDMSEVKIPSLEYMIYMTNKHEGLGNFISVITFLSMFVLPFESGISTKSLFSQVTFLCLISLFQLLVRKR